jgi:vitamin B12 transporter
MAGGGARAGYSLSVTRLDTDGILAFNNQHTNTVLNGRARFAPSVASEADISFRVGDRSFHFPTDGSGNVADRNAFSFGDEALVGAKLLHAFTPRLSVEARAAVSGTDGGSEDAQDNAADSIGFFGFASFDHIRRASMDVRAHWQTDRLTLTGGWEFEEESQRSFTESLSQWGNSTGRSENSRLNRAYFAHATGERGAVAFNLGGRIEDNEQFGTFRTWQLGATWVVPGASGLRLRGSAGRGMKEPTFFETFATGFAIGNPALEPEVSTSWEIGADASLQRGRIHVRGTWFDQSFRNLIQYTFAPAEPGGPNYFNVAAATGRGAELEARVEGGRLNGGISWTLLASEVTDSGFDQGPAAAFVVGEPLLRRPRHTVRANANARLGRRLNVFADVSVVGVRADRDFSSFPATPVVLRRYSDVGIGASVDVLLAQAGRPGFVLTLRIENVLDREIQHVFGFDAPGRGVYLGGSVAFGG